MSAFFPAGGATPTGFHRPDGPRCGAPTERRVLMNPLNPHEQVLASRAPTHPDVGMLIDGEERSARSGAWIEVSSPARSGSVLARVPRADATDVDEAVAAARRALAAWRARPATARQAALLAAADSIARHAEELALLTASDTGNALRTQARPEVADAGQPVPLLRRRRRRDSRARCCPRATTSCSTPVREPLGVVGADPAVELAAHDRRHEDPGGAGGRETRWSSRRPRTRR